MKNKKLAGGIVIFSIIIVLTALSVIFALTKKSFNMNFFSGKNGYIAELYIEGVIQNENQNYNQKWLLSTISMLKNDPKNKGIAIFINSPGGTVYEADEVYLALQNYKTKAKPVYVYQGPLAASGGYYISCAGNKIFANRNTLTGSIGVIMGSSIDATGLLEKLGIKAETIHSGKNKNMFNFDEPVNEEQRAIMQSLADECYEQFTGIVAISRNIPLFEVKKLADGRIYSAHQALQNGLIDGIDSWQNMIATMKTNEFNGKDLKTKTFRYDRQKTMKDLILGSSKDTTLSTISDYLNRTRIQYPAYLYE